MLDKQEKITYSCPRCRSGIAVKKVEYSFKQTKYLLLKLMVFGDLNLGSFKQRPQINGHDENRQDMFGESPLPPPSASIPPIQTTNSGVNWRAIATIVHDGGETPDTGHYYAMGRWEEQAEWTVMDDERQPSKRATLNPGLLGHYIIIYENLSLTPKRK